MTNSLTARSVIAGVVAVLAAAAALPAATSAATAKSTVTSKAVHRPPDGKWKWYTSSQGDTKGTLTVSHHGKDAKDISLIPPAACGKGRITVLGGPFKIRAGGPGGGTQWYVGATPTTLRHVKLRQGKTTTAGQLSVYFLDDNGESITNVTRAGCDMSWGSAAPRHTR